jgi:murein L,D-transpeptidase YafK
MTSRTRPARTSSWVSSRSRATVSPCSLTTDQPARGRSEISTSSALTTVPPSKSTLADPFSSSSAASAAASAAAIAAATFGKYAVVVDTQKSRLYLYQNDNGTPRFVADYYISQGKLGAEKAREGDKKTPIGVYHVTASLPRQRLTDFYGSGAFPINYPNEWDKRQGRNGHGIWLHGTPSNTFSRPPKASDGCVVLANQDLDSLAKNLQVGLTPVIISNSIEWLSLDDWQNERSSLLKNVEEWRQDWESRNVDSYAQHYSHKFKSDGQGYREWIEHKRKVNAGKSWIKVGTGNISMFRNPGREEYVVVTFEQDYRSSNLSGQMKKRQYWIKEGGRWKIVFEGSA